MIVDVIYILEQGAVLSITRVATQWQRNSRVPFAALLAQELRQLKSSVYCAIGVDSLAYLVQLLI